MDGMASHGGLFRLENTFFEIVSCQVILFATLGENAGQATSCYRTPEQI